MTNCFRTLFGLRISLIRFTPREILLQATSYLDYSDKLQMIKKTNEIRILPLTVNIPLQDSLLVSTVTQSKECNWNLRLKTCWNKYILIYVRLQNSKSALESLFHDIKNWIDCIQRIENDAILIHCKEDASLIKLLKMNSPIFGVLMIVLRKNGGFDVFKSKDIIPYLDEMNKQLIKHIIPLRARVVFYVWGISINIPQLELIAYFKKIGKLISWRFAPIGQFGKFHVIQLQYARFLNLIQIKDLISNYSSATMILHI